MILDKIKQLQKKATYRHKSMPSVPISFHQKRRGLKPLTKPLDVEGLTKKAEASFYGKWFKKARDAGASEVLAFKYANALLLNRPTFGLQRSIFGGIKNEKHDV